MKQSDTSRLLTVCAWLGIALVVVIALATRFLSVVRVSREIPMGASLVRSRATFVPPNEPLGELGSHCGGPLRLPCRPGLSCSIDHVQSEMLGKCVKREVGASESLERAHVAQVGENCVDETQAVSLLPCATGLFCMKGRPADVCAVMTAASPKVSRVTLEGAQFDNGTYRAKAGRAIAVHVEVLNETQVQMRMGEPGAEKDAGLLKKNSDGTYVGTLVIPSGFSGDVQIVVRGNMGDFSVFTTSVAAL